MKRVFLLFSIVGMGFLMMACSGAGNDEVVSLYFELQGEEVDNMEASVKSLRLIPNFETELLSFELDVVNPGEVEDLDFDTVGEFGGEYFEMYEDVVDLLLEDGFEKLNGEGDMRIVMEMSDGSEKEIDILLASDSENLAEVLNFYNEIMGLLVVDIS